MFVSSFILLGLIYNFLPVCVPFEELILPCLIFMWILNIKQRILHRRIRLYLIITGFLAFFYIFLREVKFNGFKNDSLNIIRVIWYLYYVPMTAIPMFSFFAAKLLGTSNTARLKKSFSLLYIPLILLITAVLTNDFHQKAFKFLPDFSNWKNSYDYGFIYVLVWVWNAFFFIGTAATAYKKSKLSIKKKYLIIPFFAPALCLVYFSFYRYDIKLPFSLAEAYCFMVIGFWEGLIRIGFVQSNINYKNYFRLSHISAQLADLSGTPVYFSENTSRTEKLIREKNIAEDDLVLHNKKISAGSIFWLEDISELNRLNRELSESIARLSEETDLLAAENRVKEEREALNEQNKIYDEIFKAAAPQLRLVSKLVSEAEKNPGLFERNMALACFFTVYVKRKSNMLLRKSRGDELSGGDLSVALCESSEYLGRCGIPCLCQCDEELPFKTEEVFAVLDMLEGFVEKNYESLTGFMINIRSSENKCIIKLTAEGRLSDERISLDGFLCSSEKEKDTVYFTLEKEGEQSYGR